MDIIYGKSSGRYDIESAMSYKTLQCFTERYREENIIIRNIVSTDCFFDSNPHGS